MRQLFNLRWNMIGLLVAVALIGLLAACGGASAPPAAEAPAAPTEEQSEAPAAEAPAAAEEEQSAPPAAEAPAAPTEEQSEAPAAEAPAAAAELPEVCQGLDGQGRRIGFGNLGESVPFAVQVREGIEKVAAECNVEVLNADNALDPQIAIDNTRLFKTQQVDGIIHFNVHGNIADSICEIVGDTPMIAVDIAHEGCSIFMGANNRQAGELAGQAAGEVAREMWDCQVDAVVTHEQPGVGQVNIDRLNGLIAGLQSVCPDNDYGNFEEWSMDPVGIITRLDSGRVDPGYQQGRDYLTANPDKEHIVSLCINDDSCLGMLAAVQEAGRQDGVIFASQGADPSVWSEIRTNPMYAGSTAYFPELYGTYLIPNIIKMIKGETVEGPILLDHVAITEDNIDQYYPE